MTRGYSWHTSANTPAHTVDECIIAPQGIRLGAVRFPIDSQAILQQTLDVRTMYRRQLNENCCASPIQKSSLLKLGFQIAGKTIRKVIKDEEKLFSLLTGERQNLVPETWISEISTSFPKISYWVFMICHLRNMERAPNVDGRHRCLPIRFTNWPALNKKSFLLWNTQLFWRFVSSHWKPK